MIVRKRIRTVGSSDEDEEEESRRKIAKMDNLQTSMNRVLDKLTSMKSTVATKEDVKKISGRFDSLENSQQSMSVTQMDIKRRLEALEKGDRPKEPHPRQLPWPITSNNAESFKEARRSLYLSPVQPHMANVKDFLLMMMKLPRDLVDDLEISDIRKRHPRNLPAHRRTTDVTRKVKISLRDSQERDVVISFATNLEAGNRME